MLIKFNKKISFYKILENLELFISDVINKLKLDYKRYSGLIILDNTYTNTETSTDELLSVNIEFERYSYVLKDNTLSIPIPWVEYDQNLDLVFYIYIDGKLLKASEYYINQENTNINFNMIKSGNIDIIRIKKKTKSDKLYKDFSFNRYNIDLNDLVAQVELPYNNSNSEDLMILIYLNGSLLTQNIDYYISNNTIIFKNGNKSGNISIIRYFKTFL